jgi:dTDP-4-dehydrorhamnose reductase
LKILITGAGGILGTDIVSALSKHDLVLTDVLPNFTAMDISDSEQVMRTIADVRPEMVIHTAAYTDVDGCEREPDKAYRLNAGGTWNVAAACRKVGARMIYISTDFVFDGTKGAMYTEYDTPNPLSVYGASKLAGETHVRTLCPEHFVVRTAWLYGVNGKSFPKTIINAAQTRKQLKVVADQIGSPTFTVDLAAKIAQTIESPLFGTYHITNKGACSWHEFALQTLRYKGINDVEVQAICSKDWPTPTKRPEYSVLRHYSLELQGMDDMRPWEDALQEFVSRI